MQKLDQKQVPQVIGLGVVAVGVFGYAIFNFALGGPKREVTAPVEKVEAVATTPSSTTAAGTTAAVTGAVNATETGAVPGAPGATGPGGVQVVQNTPPAMPLPGQYNPDPFRSAVKTESPVNVTPKAAGSSPASRKAMGLSATAAGITGAQTDTKPAETEAQRAAREKVEREKEKARLLAVARTVRPEIVVRGTSVVDGMNLAILEVGQDHRVVQTGDVLDNHFKVKKIKLEGIWVTGDNGKDMFFVPVGAKSEPKKSDNAEGPAA
jgi:hypothetical protein